MSAAERDSQFMEVRLLQNLRHQHVVRYKAHLLTDRNLFLLMEYAAGGTLESLMKQKGLPAKNLPTNAGRDTKLIFNEEELWMILAQLATALHYLHGVKKVIHRDLKPANVLFFPEPSEDRRGLRAGIFKLADVGLSRALSSSHAHAFTVCG
eukprot:Rmarinus@m.23800